MNRRWRIVLVASFLAFFMEYSLRGINGLLRQPLVAAVVFANYFTYLALIEEFIGRFRLKDYQVWIMAQLFALIWQLLGVSGIYWPPFVLGINVYLLVLNNLIWWPTIQTLFALYVAHRVTPDADRSQPLLNRFGIAVFFLLFVLVSASWRLLATPPITPWQLSIMLCLTSTFAVLAGAMIFLNRRRGVELPVFKADRVLDVVAVLMAMFLTFSFFFLTDPEARAIHQVNIRALIANVMVSPLIALALLWRRIASKGPIPI